MSYIIESPFPSFNDTDGSPLNNGYVYVGSANLNPVTDPIPVYWDAALTQPAAQPIRTINGYLSRNGSPGRIYTSFVTYSFRVTNNKGEQVFSDLNYTDPTSNAGSTYQQVITAIAGQTVFNLSRTYIPGTNNLFVYRNGLRLIVGQDYNETGYSQVTLTDGADNGDEFVFDIGYNYDSAASVDAQDVTYKLPAVDSVFTNVEAKPSETVSVKDFGAVGDGTTDDTAAIQAAIDYVASIKGGTVTFTERHLIDGVLTVKDYVSLQGPLGMPDELLPAVSADYDSQSGVLILNQTATIYTNDGASVCNCLIIRKGLNLPFADAAAATAGIAAFAGTALTVAGAGSYFHHLLILGFNQAIYSNAYERIRCEYVLGDCTNGIHLREVYDIAYVENCHFWPWTTTHNTWTIGSPAVLLKRSGTAYKFSDVCDWGKLTNCFSYGYEVGFAVQSCDHVNIIGCGADHYSPDTNSTSVGFAITGTSENTLLLGCQAASQSSGVVINTTEPITVNSHRIQSCNFWENDSSAIAVVRGRAIISGCEMKSTVAAANGIVLYDTSDGITATGNDFSSFATTVAFVGASSAAVLRKSTFHANRFTNCIDVTGQTLSIPQGTLNFLRATVTASIANGFYFDARTSRGTFDAPTASQIADTAIGFRGYLWDGNDYRTCALLRAQSSVNASAGNAGGQWIISTTPSGSVSPVDRLSLLDSGHLAPLADNAYLNGINGNRWSAIWAANGTIQTSDAREKTDIADASLGLSFINALRPVSYKWIEGSKEVVRQVFRDAQGNECEATADGAIPSEIITKSIPGKRTHWGLLAQDVKAACDAAGVDFGGWVLTEKDNQDSQQALRYDQFIAPLIKAVQELSKRVAELESK